MIVFVHGVPETAAIWDSIRSRSSRPSLALAMPGFDCARPNGFGATKDDYVHWLLGELDPLEGPIDLVGHDWGAALTYRVATAFGDRLHSWAADVGNIIHPRYQWHDFAKIWQTPGDGEAFVENTDAQTPRERAGPFEFMGVPAADALAMATAFDATMGACILDLYRSATPNLHDHWGPWSPTVAPGLVLHASDDPFGDETLAMEVAAALGAQFATITGAGHFWPYQYPAEALAVLDGFWASLD
ncbi:MAG: alpha/beta hydrolase [Acidimicrobiia bacterium]|nr:alpha/beta hydrolase [Acidimicrobiia bacterium]